MVKVTWTLQSIEDMQNIAEYISKDSLKYARIQVSDFFETAKILETYPKSGRIVPEFSNTQIREIIIGYYRLIYRITRLNHIDILTVHHSRMILKTKSIKKG